MRRARDASPAATSMSRAAEMRCMSQAPQRRFSDQTRDSLASQARAHVDALQVIRALQVVHTPRSGLVPPVGLLPLVQL